VKRLLVITLALVILLSSAVAVAQTGTTTLTGASSLDFSGVLTTVQIQGTFDGRLGKGTYAGTLVAGSPFTSSGCGPVCQPVTGQITFASKRGDFAAVVQPGGVVELTDIASTSSRVFRLTLRVVSGTRSYKHADGALTLVYVFEERRFFDEEANQFVVTRSESGTLTGNARK
jgi:hypothetical protein